MRERFYWLFFLGCLFVSMGSLSQNIPPSKKPRVVLFFSLECPICQKYVPELNRIYHEYSPRVDFEVVIPEKSEAKLIQKFIASYKAEFPIYVDKSRLTRSLNPAVTPEVYLLNSTGKLVYKGAIDNWFYELGRYRTEPSEFYLRNALESTLLGVEPKIVKTEAIGCIISAHIKHGNWP